MSPHWRGEAPGFITGDLMAEYAFNDEYKIKANVNNVTNKLYADGLYRGHYIPGAGRTTSFAGDHFLSLAANATMLLTIANVLNAAELLRIRTLIEQAPWASGRESAGRQAARQKQ
ncbi:MAG: TonB-dependent receptor [Burkholderiales bacterium]